MTKVTAEHIQAHTITEYEHFPEHNARTETLEFRNAKHELESIEHLGCYVCGTMTKRESHHIFERSLWNGLDVKLVAHLLFEHFDFHGHVKRDFKSEDELRLWFITKFNGYVTTEDVDGKEVDVWHCSDEAADTIYNQWILCETHHRGMGTGVHGSTLPSFFGWLARKPGFEPTFNKEHALAYMASLNAKHEEMKRDGLHVATVRDEREGGANVTDKSA